MAQLEMRDVHVRAGDREILKGLDLTVDSGQVHALMGPNGSGKSTLANAIMGHPNFEVIDGQILFDGQDITEAEPDERARMGLFMAFQYPVAVPGVTVTKYLRTVMNALREEQGEVDYLAALEVALEHDVTHLDTASGYGAGNSERMIGRFIAADPETQPTFQNVCDLFVLVRMPRDDGAFLEIHVRQHHSIAGDQLA